MKVFAFDEKVCGVKDLDMERDSIYKFLGGCMVVVELVNGLVLLCNGSGKRLNLKERVAVVRRKKVIEVIHGNCFVCRLDERGNYTPILDNDIAVIKDVLKPVVSCCSEEIVFVRTDY